MISKRLCTVLNQNGRYVLQKLDLGTKCLLNISSHNNFYHAKSVSFFRTLNTNEFHVYNVALRRLCTNTAIQGHLTENNFAHHVMENSEAYSNTLTKPLSSDQELQSDAVESLLQKQWISMSSEELLQNFEHLSYYAAKNKESINDSKYSGVLEVLTNKCPDFSDKEIHHLLSCLEFWRLEKSEPTNLDLLKALDDQCLARMPKWTQDEIFLTNDQFYKLRLSRSLEFTWRSLKKVGFKSKNLTPAKLVQYAFFLKVNRRLPVNMYEIEYQLETCIDDLTLEEIAIIAMAFEKYQTPIRSTTLLIKILEKLISKLDTVHDITLKSILEIVRFGYDVKLQNHLKVLLESLANQVPRLTMATLGNVMLLKKRILMYNEQLTSKIVHRCETEIKDTKTRDIEKVLLGLETFDYNPKTTPLYSLAYKELLDPSRAEFIEKSPIVLVQIMMHMLRQEFYAEEILKRIMEPEYVKKVSKGDIYKLDRMYLDLDFLIELEHPEYDGPRLRIDLLNFLMKRHGSLKKENILKELKVSRADKLLIDIAHVIKKLAGSETAVHTDSVLPQFTKVGIVVCHDPETKEFISPSEKLNAIPEGKVKYAPDDGKNWYVFIIGTQNLVTRDETHRWTGTLTSEIRLLKRIGYTPIVIPHYEWLNLTSQSSKEKYITDALCK